MQNSKQKATATLPHVEKYTYRGEDSDNNLAGQSLNKKDTSHIDDDDEVSLCSVHELVFTLHAISLEITFVSNLHCCESIQCKI